jgi:hypothetical protein
MACSALPLQIAANNLRHCYYLALRCLKDGEIRVAAEESPSDECYLCPLCQEPCCFVPLGEGGTSRPLPFFGRPQDAYSFQEADRRLWQDLKRRQVQA